MKDARTSPPLFVDAILVIITFILLFFSIVMIYSTTGVLAADRYGDALYYVKRQGMSAGVGIVLMLACSQLNPELLKRFSRVFYAMCLVALLATLLPGLGDRAGGAQRWINLGVVRLQPGEFVKLMFTIAAAGFFARHEHQLGTFRDGVVKPLCLVGALGVLFLLQPDYGSTAVVIILTLSMALVSGVRIRYFAICILFCSFVLSSLIIVAPYRMARVATFLDRSSDLNGKGYQLNQSLIALGSGELTGKGLGRSQQKLDYLPAAHTDFIFAVIGEELGFVGCLSVIGLFLLLLWRGLSIAVRLSHNTFCSALATGLILMIVAPAFLNAGVVSGLLPTKGMVLPLVGYGGTSLVTCLMAIGLLLALARSLYRGSV